MGAFHCFLSVFEDLLYAYQCSTEFEFGMSTIQGVASTTRLLTLSVTAVGVSRKIRMLNPQLKHVSYDRDKLALKPFYPETV